MGKKSRKTSAGAEHILPDLPDSARLKHAHLRNIPLLAHPALHLAVIFAIGIIAYASTLYYPFVFDDLANIVQNPATRSFEYFADPSMATGMPVYRFFESRLVGYLSFACNYKFGGLDPAGYHLANIAIHLLSASAVYLVYILLGQASGQSGARVRYGALLAGALFVAHPVNTQAVTFIVQRFASLSALFCLISFALYAMARLDPKSRKRFLLYALALIFSALAMRTKETSFMLPVAIMLFDVLFIGGAWRKRMKYLIPLMLTMLIVPVSMMKSGGQAGEVIGGLGDATRLQSEISRLQYLITEWKVGVHYLRLLLLPFGQSLDHDVPLAIGLDRGVIASFLVLASALASAFFMLSLSRRMGGKGGPLLMVSFGIFWFFIMLVTESTVIPIIDVMFEHRLYLPSAGIFIALASALMRAHEKTRAPWFRALQSASFFIIPLMLMLLARERNTVWRDNLTLWGDVVAKAPHKARGHNNLGIALSESGEYDRALKEFSMALGQFREIDAQAYNNMAMVSIKNNRMDDAIAAWQHAIEIDPRQKEPHYNLGTAYYQSARYEEAIGQLQEAVRLDPGYANAYENLGLSLLAMGRADEGLTSLKRYKSLSPDTAPMIRLGLALFSLGRYEAAIAEFDEALRLDPACVTCVYNIACAYNKKGMTREALKHFEKVEAMGLEDAEMHMQMGLIYREMNDEAKAMRHIKDALRLDPSLSPTRGAR